jgi:hypothetical protein
MAPTLSSRQDYMMVFRNLLLLSLLSLATLAQAQTRKLAHRSHAGNPNTFAMLMDDDHGGGPVPEKYTESWNLDPWVIKIRKHYEEVAKKTGPVEAKHGEGPQAAPKEGEVQPADPNAPAREPQKQKSKPIRNKSVKTDSPSPMAEAESGAALPRIRLAKAIAGTQGNAGGSLWLLAGIIVSCVAPGVLLLSGAWRRKS